MKKSSLVARLIVLCGFLFFVFAISWWYRDLFLMYIKSWIGHVERGVATHRVQYASGYVGLYVLDSLLALPLASFLAFLAGRFFGFWLGFSLSMLGMILGALISFVFVRYLVGCSFQETYQDKLTWFNNIFARYGLLFLIVVRFIPIVPFSLLNILAAFTSVSLFSFFVTTCLGMAPLLLFLTFLGRISIDFGLASMHSFLGWFSLGGIAAGLIIFLIKKYRTVLS